MGLTISPGSTGPITVVTTCWPFGRAHPKTGSAAGPFTRQEVEARADWFYDNRQIKYALFERYGIMAAAGDRHLAEFVPGFTHSPEVLFRWGVIRTPVSYRKGVWEQSSRFARDVMEGKIKVDLHSSGEEAVRQIKALVGLGDFVTNVNFRPGPGYQPAGREQWWRRTLISARTTCNR